MGETKAREINQGPLGPAVYETMTEERFLAVKKIAKDFGMQASKASIPKGYMAPGGGGGENRKVETFLGQDNVVYRVPENHVYVRIDNPEGKSWTEFWEAVEKQEVAPPAHI